MKEKENNSELIYQYTNQLLIETNNGVYKTSQKISTLIGFSGLLIKFASELSSCYPLLLWTKTGSIIALIFSLIFCSIALKSKSSGIVIDDRELIEDWWYKSDELTRLFIMRQWSESIDDLYKVYRTKSRYINNALYAIITGSVFFGINSLIANFKNCS